jgi:hypothetical protein
MWRKYRCKYSFKGERQASGGELTRKAEQRRRAKPSAGFREPAIRAGAMPHRPGRLSRAASNFFTKENFSCEIFHAKFLATTFCVKKNLQNHARHD